MACARRRRQPRSGTRKSDTTQSAPGADQSASADDPGEFFRSEAIQEEVRRDRVETHRLPPARDCTLPPHPAKRRTHRVPDHVPRIGSRPRQILRADPSLEQHGQLAGDVRGNLGQPRRPFGAPTAALAEPRHQRQCAGNEPDVVEVPTDERGRHVGSQQPRLALYRVTPQPEKPVAVEREAPVPQESQDGAAGAGGAEQPQPRVISRVGERRSGMNTFERFHDPSIIEFVRSSLKHGSTGPLLSLARADQFVPSSDDRNRVPVVHRDHEPVALRVVHHRRGAGNARRDDLRLLPGTNPRHRSLAHAAHVLGADPASTTSPSLPASTACSVLSSFPSGRTSARRACRC